MVETLPSSAESVGLIPSQRARIPHAFQPRDPNTEAEAIL